jgi:hypothetical protein
MLACIKELKPSTQEFTVALEVIHLIPCERIETDPDDLHRCNVIGLITSIQTLARPPFPLRHREFMALVICTGGKGTGELQLRIVADSMAKAIYRTRPRQVRFVGDAAAIGGVVYRLQNCVFPSAGLYWVEVVYDRQIIARQRLIVKPWEVFS